MFPVLCLITFGVFCTYWVLEIACKKSIKIIKSYSNQQNTQANQLTSQKINLNELKEQIQPEQTSQYKITLSKQPPGQSKLTAASATSSINSSKVPPLSNDFNSNIKTNNSEPNKQIEENNINLNPNKDRSELNNKQQYQMASSSNALNVGMIQDKNVEESRQQNKKSQMQEELLDHINQDNKFQHNSGILSQIKKQQQQEYALNKASNQIFPQSNHIKQQNNQIDPSPHITSQRQSYFQRRQQRSQLQFIQALSPHRIPQKTDHVDFQIIPQLQKKQNENDIQITKLIQQIDQLFLNDQQQFMKIINKYKVNEARYTNNTHDEQNKQQSEKIQKLQDELKKKTEDMQIMQIQVSEYKSVNQKLQNQINDIKKIVNQLEQGIKLLQLEKEQLNKKYQKIQQTNNTQKQQHFGEINKLHLQNVNLKQKLQYLKQNSYQNDRKQSQPNQVHLKILQLQLRQKQKQIDSAKQQILLQKQQISKLTYNLQQLNKKNLQGQTLCNNLQKLIQAKTNIIQQLNKEIQNKNVIIENNSNHINQMSQSKDKQRITEQIYMKKLSQFEQQIQRIRDQATQQKKKYQETLNKKIVQQTNLDFIKQQQPNYIPISTRQHLVSSQQNRYQTPQPSQLEKINQNLKNQIEFAQTQIRMFEQSEASYIKQIQQLQKQLQLVQSVPKTEIIQLRTKISRMQPIVNQYQIMQRRYFELKLKYQKLSHQKGKLNSSGNSGKKEDGSSFVMPTSPKNQKISAFRADSPISSYNNQAKGSPIGVGHYKFLFDCLFIDLQDRQFVYETLRSLLKGVLKTEKLYSSKTNRLKNPHELIDNIRGILLIVQLQNDKIIGAYTHQSFSSMHPQSSNDNIAFILDVTNHRYFANQSGLNSISYNPNSLIWGFNEIMLKYEEMDVMYTNFCRNHNIYWDGKYRIQDFIGADKQWARINQYQIFRVSKI